MENRATLESKIPRRRFVKRAVYTAPAIVTLAVVPSFAKAGSVKKPKDPKDPKEPNDRGW